MFFLGVVRMFKTCFLPLLLLGITQILTNISGSTEFDTFGSGKILFKIEPRTTYLDIHCSTKEGSKKELWHKIMRIINQLNHFLNGLLSYLERMKNNKKGIIQNTSTLFFQNPKSRFNLFTFLINFWAFTTPWFSYSIFGQRNYQLNASIVMHFVE